jgi:hypothetical protein
MILVGEIEIEVKVKVKVEFGVWDDWDCDKDKQGAAIVRD